MWTEIAALYEKESLSRAGFNSRNYSSFSDFRSEGFAGWYPDGLGVDRSPAGEFTVDSEGNRALTGVLLAGVYTHVLSERLNGALRSPFLPKDKKFLSLRVMGGKLSAHRTIVDDCVLGEHYQLLETDEFSWVTIPTRSEKTSLPVYVELVTKRDNPRLPDRPTKSKKATPENLKAVGSYFGISRAVVHDDAVPPYEELTHMRRLFEGPAPTDIGEMAARYQDVFRKALTAWSEGTATDDDLKWVDWLVRRDLVVNSRDLTPALGQLIDRYRAIETRLSNPRVVHSMADLGPGYDFPLLRAGNAKDPGDPVPRGYLSLIAEGSGRFHTSGSGRLELAELITSAHNPLTARVIVNRVWHYVFGRGIVRTVDNFGRFGARPSHPELLDYLASWFVDNGWSVKKLIRLLVLSETFQQSSRPDPAALQARSDQFKAAPLLGEKTGRRGDSGCRSCHFGSTGPHAPGTQHSALSEGTHGLPHASIRPSRRPRPQKHLPEGHPHGRTSVPGIVRFPGTGVTPGGKGFNQRAFSGVGSTQWPLHPGTGELLDGPAPVGNRVICRG